MKKAIKNNYKIIIGFVIGILVSATGVYAVDAYIESKKIAYENKYTDKTNTQDAIDELYERSGIHQEKWVDPILNGADPVLKEPLIPVEIKDNGDVYYANLNSEWYNYSEKRWANAVILTDTAKEYKDDKKYKVGMQIKEADIESYFVWIPRYQYKVWDLGNYSTVIDSSTIITTKDTSDNALWKLTGSNARLIDIQFGTYEKYPKMVESAANVDEYYTHPAFTLGDKNLNGIWVGKFETGGSATNITIKPNVYSWCSADAKTFFDAAKGYESGLDSHMLKNTEWGAVTYLSHSKYGIGTKIRINNSLYHGRAVVSNVSQNDSVYNNTFEETQSWNTNEGYLASTTGNITGIYDMSGCRLELVAAYLKGQPGSSGFELQDLENYVNDGYIDLYTESDRLDKRILGDATGELGPFYQYYDFDDAKRVHNSWYYDNAAFITNNYPWFTRGGSATGVILTGQFNFGAHSGAAAGTIASRMALAAK